MGEYYEICEKIMFFIFIGTMMLTCSCNVTMLRRYSELRKGKQKIKNDVSRRGFSILIGLSKANEEGKKVNFMHRIPDNYRTLIIRNDRGRVSYIEKAGTIITWYKNNFWKLINQKFMYSKKNNPKDIFGNRIFDKYEYYYNFSSITASLFNKKVKNLYTPKYINDTFLTKDNINNLKKRDKVYKLGNMLDSNSRKQLKAYKKQYDKIIASNKYYNEKQRLDIKNLILRRHNGQSPFA